MVYHMIQQYMCLQPNIFNKKSQYYAYDDVCRPIIYTYQI